MALDRLARELRKLIDEKKVVICEKEQQVLAVIKQTTKTLEGWDDTTQQLVKSLRNIRDHQEGFIQI